jgi:hypothetical protein
MPCPSLNKYETRLGPVLTMTVGTGPGRLDRIYLDKRTWTGYCGLLFGCAAREVTAKTSFRKSS